jgi:hypothetical protein
MLMRVSLDSAHNRLNCIFLPSTRFTISISLHLCLGDLRECHAGGWKLLRQIIISSTYLALCPQELDWRHLRRVLFVNSIKIT